MEQETNALGDNRKKIKTIYDPEIPVDIYELINLM
jgi:metal-sulfur cluster biosynthetic enzyme